MGLQLVDPLPPLPDPEPLQGPLADNPPPPAAFGKPWFYDGTLLGWATYLDTDVVEVYAAMAAHGGHTVTLCWEDEYLHEYGAAPIAYSQSGIAIVGIDEVGHSLECLHPSQPLPFGVATDRVHSIRIDLPDPKPPERHG